MTTPEQTEQPPDAVGHDVFISYSAKDKILADAVCAALESDGIRCWIAPRDILPGESWATAILRGIASGRMMVLLFSASANTSAQVRREVERAVHHGIPIAPIRIQDVMPEGDLEYFLSSQHWMDAITTPFEQHLRQMALKLRTLLNIKRSVPGERTAEPDRQILDRPQSQVDHGSGIHISADGSQPAGKSGFSTAHSGGMDIADSVIKGDVTSGSASVGNINISVGQGSAGGMSAELEYEKCVMLTLRSGGSLESIRRELDDRRLAIGLPIRLAREIEIACLESCARKPIQGRSPTIPAGPSGPDPLTRFFKSASDSFASMFAHPKPAGIAPPKRPPPTPPVVPSTARATGKGPPPVPRSTPAPSSSEPKLKPNDEAAVVKETIKEELRDGLKADLAHSVEKKADRQTEDPAPAPRKPPPLPGKPPPLQWPPKGK